jgi:ubiquinone/menaquinone biosynthesis C-methylase UbiE
MEQTVTPVESDRLCPDCGSLNRVTKFIEPPFRIVKCCNCALVYLGNPSDDGLIYEEYYGSHEPDGRKYRANSDDPSLAELYAINMERIVRLKKMKPVGKLLDVGCGRGNFLKIAQDHGFNVQGIDISKSAIEYARKHFGVNADDSTLDDLVSTDARFDVITLWHVLEHLVEPFNYLLQVRSLLKDEGICIVEVPNLNSLKFQTARHKWKGGNHPLYHRTFFTVSTLRRALLKTGFQSVRRLRLSYRLPGRNRIYEGIKAALNVVGMDSFLAFVAEKQNSSGEDLTSG